MQAIDIFDNDNDNNEKKSRRGRKKVDKSIVEETILTEELIDKIIEYYSIKSIEDICSEIKVTEKQVRTVVNKINKILLEAFKNQELNEEQFKKGEEKLKPFNNDPLIVSGNKFIKELKG